MAKNKGALGAIIIPTNAVSGSYDSCYINPSLLCELDAAKIVVSSFKTIFYEGIFLPRKKGQFSWLGGRGEQPPPPKQFAVSLCYNPLMKYMNGSDAFSFKRCRRKHLTTRLREPPLHQMW